MTSRRQTTGDVNRRPVLTGALASASALALAGCLDATDDSSDSSANGSNADADGDETEAEADDEGTNGNSSSDDDETADELHAEYETTDVRVRGADGEELGEVTAAIADTRARQQLGLSDTESLPADRGMLFVYEDVADRRFAMPEMSFGIDIVFADEEGVITSIANAPEPGPDEDGSEQTYEGRGQYVLEVVYEWTDERGVAEGDVLEFDL
ncbi:DUF192 domain-containing protein [Natronolimnohabitans innermongolicus]|nr:DUF192 domain-containing protein [Natronolimnohabitans innermongolicus]